MQYPEVAAEFTGRMTTAVRPLVERLDTTYTEMKSEVRTVWSNADVRDDVIRTAMIAGVVLCAVTVLVFVTSWMAPWLRLSIIFLTLGILGKWMMSKIAESADDL